MNPNNNRHTIKLKKNERIDTNNSLTEITFKYNRITKWIVLSVSILMPTSYILFLYLNNVPIDIKITVLISVVSLIGPFTVFLKSKNHGFRISNKGIEFKGKLYLWLEIESLSKVVENRVLPNEFKYYITFDYMKKESVEIPINELNYSTDKIVDLIMKYYSNFSDK